MSHLESLIAEYLDWQGFLVMRNKKVGKRDRGGWEMELDIVGYHPKSGKLVHYEPSLDATSWRAREARYIKKFEKGREYILKEIFPWLASSTVIERIAVFVDHPRNRNRIAGGRIVSIDELMADIRVEVIRCGPMSRNAIPEQYPLLRTLQMSHVGYLRAIDVGASSVRAVSASEVAPGGEA